MFYGFLFFSGVELYINCHYVFFFLLCSICFPYFFFNFIHLRMEKSYPPEVEAYMVTFFDNLNEKDRRHYAAVEALKLGYSGLSYISDLFGINTRTVLRGMDEIKKKT